MSVRNGSQCFGTPSLLYSAETRLKRPGSRLFPPAPTIATSFAPSGWLATATTKHVYLYNVRGADQNQAIAPSNIISVSLVPNEKIRDAALSEDLLVVLTYSRLLVYYEYQEIRTDERLVDSLVEAKSIDREQFSAVSIAQAGTAAMGQGAVATLIVGGVGTNGVTLFKYIFDANNRWKVLKCRILLKCPQNIGMVRKVGFSPYRDNTLYGPLSFGLTANNHLYCWRLNGIPDSGSHIVQPSWHVDCNSSQNRHVSDPSL